MPSDHLTILVFSNPIAGRGKGRDIAQAIVSELHRRGYDARPVLRRPHDLKLTQTPAAVVAIGGDGTIRAVAHRLLQLFPSNPPPILIVPMGTANLLGRHLGI